MVNATRSTEQHSPTLAWCMAFAGVPASIREVRRFLVNVLGSREIEPLLVASELATNAIKHTASGGVGGQFVLRVSRYSDRVGLRIDDQGSPQAPRIVGDDDLADTGRGLALVEKLSLRWGVRGNEQSRTVWADLVLPSDRTKAIDAEQNHGAANGPPSPSEGDYDEGSGAPP